MFRAINIRQNWVALLLVSAFGFWLMISGGQQTHHQFDIKNVSVSDANNLITAGALVIDVRDQEKFNFRHIPGAILIPLDVLRAGIPAIIAAAKEKTIIVYCNEGLSHGPEGTAILMSAGFKGAVNLESGIEGWARSGLPIQKG